MSGGFNWLTLANLLMQVPKIVLGVEGIVTEAKSGATKKQLALDSLAAAATITDGTVPQYQSLTDTAAAALGASIDLWSNVFNSLGIFKHSTPTTPTVTPVPVTTSVTPAGN